MKGKQDLQGKFWALYDFLSQEVFRLSGYGAVRVGERSVVPALFFPLLSAVLDDSVLLLGEPGAGKSSLAHIIASLVSGLPYRFFLVSELRGHPELTAESLIGNLDLAELNKGKTKVYFTYFIKSPVKIIDEIYRIPPAKQNLLLQGMSSGVWTHFFQHFRTGRTPVLATGNWEDAGSYSLLPPLLNRFSLAVEVAYMGPIHSLTLVDRPLEDRMEELGLNEGFDKTLEAADIDGQGAFKALLGLGEELKSRREANGIAVLKRPELAAIKKAIREVGFSSKRIPSCSHLSRRLKRGRAHQPKTRNGIPTAQL